MKKILFLICLVGLFAGCSSSDDYEFQTSKCETAADKIYELADDYGLKVKVGSLYSSLSPDKVDLEKFEKLFRGLARLKGTHVVEGVKQNNSIVYKCVSNQKRRRSMSSEATSVYAFAPEDLGAGFYGECCVVFHHYGEISSTYKCDVSVQIYSGYYLGTCSSNLKKTLERGGYVSFSGDVSYTYTDNGEDPFERHYCIPSCSDCDFSCEFDCVCLDCLLAGTNRGNGETVTVTFSVDGECSEAGGTIHWR